MGPCMCGDTCCPSCGPAQGNWRCPLCRAWASEACEHIDEETGAIKAEFKEEVERIAAAERAADDAYAQDIRELEQMSWRDA